MPSVNSGSAAIKAKSEDTLDIGDPVKVIGLVGQMPVVRRALAREKPDFFSGSRLKSGDVKDAVISVHDWIILATETKSESAAWDGSGYVFSKMRSRMGAPPKAKKSDTTEAAPTEAPLWTCGRVLRVGEDDSNARTTGLLLLGKE